MLVDALNVASGGVKWWSCLSHFTEKDKEITLWVWFNKDLFISKCTYSHQWSDVKHMNPPEGELSWSWWSLVEHRCLWFLWQVVTNDAVFAWSTRRILCRNAHSNMTMMGMIKCQRHKQKNDWFWFVWLVAHLQHLNLLWVLRQTHKEMVHCGFGCSGTRKSDLKPTRRQAKTCKLQNPWPEVGKTRNLGSFGFKPTSIF
jgi:hypothetical protein